MSLRNHARRLHHHFARRDHSNLDAREAAPQPVPQLERIRNDDRGENVGDMATLVSVVFVTAPKTFNGPAVMVTDVGAPLEFAAEPDRNQEEDPTPRPRPVVQSDNVEEEQDNVRGGDGEEARGDDQPSRPQPLPQPSRGETRPEEAQPQPTDDLLLPVGIADESSRSSPPPPRDTDILDNLDDNGGTAAGRTGSLASLTGSLAATATATAIAGGEAGDESGDESGGGISPGATAGIVIGVLLIVGALLVGAFFYSRKKRRDREGLARLNDEKSNNATNRAGPAVPPPPPPPMTSKDSVRTARTASTAPRLSLRPLTAFVPNLASDGKTSGNQLEMQSPFSPSASKEAPTGDLPPSPLSSSPPRGPTTPGYVANDPANPFGNHAEPIDKSPTSDRSLAAPAAPAAVPMPVPVMAPVIAPAPVLSISAAPPSRPTLGGPLKTDSVSLISGLLPAGANGSQASLVTPPNGLAPQMNATPDQGMAAAMAARSVPAAPNRPFAAPPKPLSVHSAVSVPLALGSPARADFGDSASIVSDGSGASPSRSPMPNNVYRVQMDYAPAMEDELDIRAGQLIRLLHEYDDGWGLCVRMDRTRQGVVPRTCLSKYPVKPRPAGQQAPVPNGRPNAPQWGPPNGPSKGSGLSPSQARGPNGRMPATGIPPSRPAFFVNGNGPSQQTSQPPAVAFPAPPHPHSPGLANMAGFGPVPMPMPMPMQERPMSPASQGRNSPGPAPYQQQQRQQQRQIPSPHFQGPPPPRSLSPGPYAAYQRPSVPESRRRSNSAGDIAPFRSSSPAEQKPSPLNPNSEGQSEPLSLPTRKPVPGVAM